MAEYPSLSLRSGDMLCVNCLTLCKKFDIRYGIFLVIFENTPKYTPEYYI